jgi:hypothetical protein
MTMQTPDPEQPMSNEADASPRSRPSFTGIVERAPRYLVPLSGKALPPSLIGNEETPLPIRLEAQRQKERLSSIPFYAKKAEKEGDEYWLRLAQSYLGKD